MADRAYTDADLDAAIAAITDPERLREAQDLVMRAAPESAGDVGLEALRKEAEQLGIQYDGRWGVPRLQQAIEAERHREPTLR